MLEPHLEDLLIRAARRDRVILASDFDGTLAPFHDDPMAVRPAPGTMAALRAAADLPGTTVALVSGRDLQTLSQLSGVPWDSPSEPLVLIGSHGAQTSAPTGPDDDSATDLLSADQVSLLDDIEAALQVICGRYPGAWVERKAAARALHTRPLDPQTSDTALAEAMAVAERYPQVHVMTGKCVVELPVLEASKGTALLALAAARHAEAVVYLGDDVTDERAFLALHPDRGDVTVKVGPGHTAAVARVPAIDDVLTCLEVFVSTRQAHLG